MKHQYKQQIEIELSVKEDRKQIAGIIKMNFPLMNKNPMMIQEVADAILFYMLGKESKQIKQLEAKRKYWEIKYKMLVEK